MDEDDQYHNMIMKYENLYYRKKYSSSTQPEPRQEFHYEGEEDECQEDLSKYGIKTSDHFTDPTFIENQKILDKS